MSYSPDLKRTVGYAATKNSAFYAAEVFHEDPRGLL
jgi:hypothetical protein